jgi:hypothetical protein
MFYNDSYGFDTSTTLKQNYDDLSVCCAVMTGTRIIDISKNRVRDTISLRP